jgi:hypothetical protein
MAHSSGAHSNSIVPDFDAVATDPIDPSPDPKCPFCRSDVHPAATVCPQCNAQKGYLSNNQGGAHSSGGMVFLLFFCLGLIAVGLIAGDVWYFFTFIGVISLPIAIVSLLRGERWYR